MRTSVVGAAGLVLISLLGACYPPVPEGSDFAVRWSREMAGPSNQDEFDGVAAGPDGSVFVTGKFERSVSLGGVALTSAGAADIPFARIDAFGRTRWAKRFGGPGEDNLFDVDAGSSGAVGTGWFESTVNFGGVVLRSGGGSDCVVVSVRDDGSVRWARALGGPYRDGCNEVTVAPDGAVVTSLDTEGGWTPPGGSPIPRLVGADTLLVRIGADGVVRWTRRVGGPGYQRGKSIAVGPDGSIDFGGDTPVDGVGRQAWLSRWTAGGTRRWMERWGGAGDDLAKGVVDDGRSVWAVGPAGPDMAVRRFALDGTLLWTATVTGDAGGAEIIGAPGGGILFGGFRVPGLAFHTASGATVPLDDRNAGTAWLAHYRPDGSVGFATTIPRADGRVGEIARRGQRVYVDIVVRRGSKDASVWALDLAN